MHSYAAQMHRRMVCFNYRMNSYMLMNLSFKAFSFSVVIRQFGLQEDEKYIYHLRYVLHQRF